MNEESPNNTFSLFLENKGTESFLIGLFALGQQLSNDTSLNENALTPNVDFASILNADTKTVNSNFTFRFNRRTSTHRGKLFYRLLQNAVRIEPVTFDQMKKNVRGARLSK